MVIEEDEIREMLEAAESEQLSLVPGSELYIEMGGVIKALTWVLGEGDDPI